MTVDPYYFMKVLSEEAPINAIVVADTGANLCWTMQGFRIHEGWVEHKVPEQQVKIEGVRMVSKEENSWNTNK